jgi:RecA-family ATPase
MDFLPTSAYNALLDEVAQADAQEAAVTAWRIEGTLREFPRFPALNVWFEYPVHHVDRRGVLADIQPEAEQPAWKRNLAKSGKRKNTPEELKQERVEAIEEAFNMCESMETPVTVKALTEYLGKSEDTVRRHLKESKKFWISEGEVGRK